MKPNKLIIQYVVIFILFGISLFFTKNSSDISHTRLDDMSIANKKVDSLVLSNQAVIATILLTNDSLIGTMDAQLNVVDEGVAKIEAKTEVVVTDSTVTEALEWIRSQH